MSQKSRVRSPHGAFPFVGRQWCIGNIEASQALAPGSTPGWRKFLPNTKKKAGRGDRTPDLPLTKRLPCHLAIPAQSDVVCKKMGTMGIEPMTNGLLDQRSTD